MSALQSTDRIYFQSLYEKATDPFRNWSNAYENGKRAMAMSLLTQKHYGRIFEPGCGNGGLSLELTNRCDKLVSVDWSPDALIAANLHCAGVANVEFQELDFPSQLPSEKDFDLLMVSELLYYYSPEKLDAFFSSIPHILKVGGEIMLIHWRGHSADYPSHGEAVHDAFANCENIQLIQVFEHPQYLISSGRLR